jgi:GNAT superfamily N-acetyltransferase
MMAGVISVRDAAGGDAGAVAELLTQLGHPSPPQAVRERLRAIAPGPGGAVVAVDGAGRVVGLVTYDAWFAFAEGTRVCRLSSLVVDRRATRAGVGTALVAEVERRARHLGCVLVELSSGRRPERDGAHRFYGALGYADTSADHVRYAKPLPGAGPP